MRTVENIIDEIDGNNLKIGELLTANKRLAKELKDKPKDEWDWISVSTACKLLDVCPASLYAKIKTGKIKSRKFETKLYVSKTEVMNINDSEVC